MAENTDKMSMKNAFNQIDSLKSRVSKLEKSIRGVRDTLNSHDNWNSEVSAWIGRDIIASVTDGVVKGKLLWVDRYNIAVEDDYKRRVVYNKGHLISIARA